MTVQKSEITVNPFAVTTPENLSAEELVNLFVPYPEFENLQIGGHQFLNGHRGSGKSMMLRMMSPDSQMLSHSCELFNLPYFGVYLSIKATELNAPEYERLENEVSGTILSEHVLTTRILSSLFSTIKYYCSTSLMNNMRQVTSILFKKLEYAGWDETLPAPDDFETVDSILDFVIQLIDKIHSISVQYIKRRAFPNTSQSYQGALIGFQDVLLPAVKALSEYKIIPKSPVYFLLDDADNLTKQQTEILNTWVSYRTTDSISLKISTQLNYKTYRTTSGAKIEDPHDFHSVDFTSVYTGSKKERYKDLVADVVRRRLTRYGCEINDPYVFFPKDENQDLAIKKIEDELKNNWKPGESGFRPGDDAYRYARPEYIRRLSGISKQGASYKYAGFEQLVHVSSGIIRFFLEPAASMFTEQLLKNSDNKVNEISPAIQDKELRKQSEKLLLNDLEDLVQEGNEVKATHQLTDIERLRNIVHGIGALFKAHIMDETSTQRRVFSFSISGEPSQDIKKILKLGVIHGYFYEDSIGTKDGMGRTILYVLTRRLAPSFSLDPIGFSSYLTVPSSVLLQIAERPLSYNSRLRKKGVDNLFSNSGQLLLLGMDNHE